jgi:hypothetical protein
MSKEETSFEDELFSHLSSREIEEIQSAKDFIWKHIDEANKKLIIHKMNSVVNGTNKLHIKKITIGY